MTLTNFKIRLFLHILYVYVNTATVLVNLNEVGTRNVQMSGKIVQSIRNIGFLMCARQCEALTSCHGINYHKSNLVCELLSEQESDPIANEGWWYVSNMDWLKQHNLSTGMDLHTCGAGQKQVRLSSGKVHCLKQDLPVDCGDNRIISGDRKVGVYTISPQRNRQFDVYCDFETVGGPWTVIQSRLDGTVAFTRTWVEYKDGFGDITGGTFWLGNDKIHSLLSARDYSLRIDMEFHDGAKYYAEYSTFYVAGENEKYKLTVDGYNGNAGDALKFHNKMMFTSKDNDNDRYSGNCATTHSGGWWFDACDECNLNGNYYKTSPVPSGMGIHWETIRSGTHSLTKVSMKVKRKK